MNVTRDKKKTRSKTKLPPSTPLKKTRTRRRKEENNDSLFFD